MVALAVGTAGATSAQGCSEVADWHGLPRSGVGPEMPRAEPSGEELRSREARCRRLPTGRGDLAREAGVIADGPVSRDQVSALGRACLVSCVWSGQNWPSCQAGGMAAVSSFRLEIGSKLGSKGGR